MNLLKDYIEEFLLERTNLSIERREPLNAYLYLVPRLTSSELQLFYNRVKEKIKIPEYFIEEDDSGNPVKSSAEFFVFDKTRDNLEEFIKLVDENWPENIDKESFKFEKNVFEEVFKEDWPLMLVQAGGDFFEHRYAQLEGDVLKVTQKDMSSISWAIHDFYHPNEGEFKNTFPSARWGEGFEFNSGLSSDERVKMLESIMDFLKRKGHAKGLGIDDVYASVWAYVAMNIDSEDQIDKLPLYNKNARDYFKYYFGLVQEFNVNWLSKFKNKVIVNYNV